MLSNRGSRPCHSPSKLSRRALYFVSCSHRRNLQRLSYSALDPHYDFSPTTRVIVANGTHPRTRVVRMWSSQRTDCRPTSPDCWTVLHSLSRHHHPAAPGILQLKETSCFPWLLHRSCVGSAAKASRTTALSSGTAPRPMAVTRSIARGSCGERSRTVSSLSCLGSRGTSCSPLPFI